MGIRKKFFLKCWVGAHSKENSGTAETVYFDAFAHDYLDDPLISLTSVIAEKFETKSREKALWEKGKSAAAKLARPLARIGLAMGTAGVSEVVGVVGDAAVAAGKDQLQAQIDTVWVREKNRQNAMLEFRQTLESLTNPNDGPTKKLVVTIDELDRCRPDYALSILEIIKHFFGVENVHFVLGINLKEIANSIRSRYGAGVDADLYLQKFINLTMSLPMNENDGNRTSSKAIKYFSTKSKEMEINKTLVGNIEFYFDLPQVSAKLSLRSADRLLTQAAIAPQLPTPHENHYTGHQLTIAGLIIMKTLFPNEYSQAREGKIDLTLVKSALGLDLAPEASKEHTFKILNSLWTRLLKPEEVDDSDGWDNLFGPHSFLGQTNPVSNIATKYVEAIQFPIALAKDI